MTSVWYLIGWLAAVLELIGDRPVGLGAIVGGFV